MMEGSLVGWKLSVAHPNQPPCWAMILSKDLVHWRVIRLTEDLVDSVYFHYQVDFFDLLDILRSPALLTHFHERFWAVFSEVGLTVDGMLDQAHVGRIRFVRGMTQQLSRVWRQVAAAIVKPVIDRETLQYVLAQIVWVYVSGTRFGCPSAIVTRIRSTPRLDASDRDVLLPVEDYFEWIEKFTGPCLLRVCGTRKALAMSEPMLGNCRFSTILAILDDLRLEFVDVRFLGVTVESFPWDEIFDEGPTVTKKQLGAFYSPDWVVRHATSQCIRRDFALRLMKVVDPSVGGGAFLLRALKQMASHIVACTTVQSIGEVLCSVMSSCLYGVDINPIAVSVARWSLMWFLPDPEAWIRVLPAIRSHVVLGDSLVGCLCLRDLYVDEFSSSASLGGVLHELLGSESDVRAYLQTKGWNGFRGTKLFEFLKLACQIRFSRRSEFGRCLDPRDVQGLRSIAPPRESWMDDSPLASESLSSVFRSSGFHWVLAFPEIFIWDAGFDLVLGNPPWEELDDTARHAGFPGSSKDAVVSSGYYKCSLSGKCNTWKLFVERSHNLVQKKSDGLACLLLPDNIRCDSSCGALRELLLSSRQGRCRYICQFPQHVVWKGVSQAVCMCVWSPITRPTVREWNPYFTMCVWDISSPEQLRDVEVYLQTGHVRRPRSRSMCWINPSRLPWMVDVGLPRVCTAGLSFLEQLFSSPGLVPLGSLFELHRGDLNTGLDLAFVVQERSKTHQVPTVKGEFISSVGRVTSQWYCDFEGWLRCRLSASAAVHKRQLLQRPAMAIQRMKATRDRCVSVAVVSGGFCFLDSVTVVRCKEDVELRGLSQLDVLGGYACILRSQLFQWILSVLSTNKNVGPTLLQSIPVPPLGAMHRDLLETGRHLFVRHAHTGALAAKAEDLVRDLFRVFIRWEDSCLTFSI